MATKGDSAGRAFKWLLSTVPLLALVGTGVNLWWSIHVNKDTSDRAYFAEAMAHRPLLRVVALDSVVSGIRGIGEVKDPSWIDGDTLKLNAPMGIELKLDVRYRIVNDGNTPAHLHLIVPGQGVDGSDDLRDSVRNLLVTLPSILKGNVPYYTHKTIMPGESIEYAASIDVTRIHPDTTFSVHLLLIYASDTKSWYDTYYWLRCKPYPFISGQCLYVKRGAVTDTHVFVRRSDLQNSVKLLDSNQDHRLYGRLEAGATAERFSRLQMSE